MSEKPLSPRRAREFRDRWLKKMFGDRKRRAERYARLVKEYGKVTADELSARNYRATHAYPDVLRSQVIQHGMSTHYRGFISTEGS